MVQCNNTIQDTKDATQYNTAQCNNNTMPYNTIQIQQQSTQTFDLDKILLSYDTLIRNTYKCNSSWSIPTLSLFWYIIRNDILFWIPCEWSNSWNFDVLYVWISAVWKVMAFYLYCSVLHPIYMYRIVLYCIVLYCIVWQYIVIVV